MKFISKTSAMLILSAAALGVAGCAVEAAPDSAAEADGAVTATEQATINPVAENAGSGASAVTEKAAPVDEATLDSTKDGQPATQEDVGTVEDPQFIGGWGYPAFGLGVGGFGFPVAGFGLGWGGLGGFGLGTGFSTAWGW